MLGKAGFTGTREGMTVLQTRGLFEHFKTYKPPEFHHGDCVGADAEARSVLDWAMAAADFTARVVSHPPERNSSRAFTEADEYREPLPYLVRDRNIVKETDYLIATPLTMYEAGGGTWQTVGFAREMSRPLLIIWRDGTLKWERLPHNCRFEYCEAPQGLCTNPE